MCEAIAALVEPFADELRVDTLGNLLALRRGRSCFKLLLDAHMDEIGFLLQHIDEQGFISFAPIGGVLSGVVSVPCRYIHSPFSTCRLSDFDHTWQLLTAFCKGATGVVK
jgi:putative aminopeptidase FrvX